LPPNGQAGSTLIGRPTRPPSAAAALPAWAGQAIHDNDHVAQFAGVVEVAMKDCSVHDDTRADAGA
jgi:hypothetical protein